MRRQRTESSPRTTHHSTPDRADEALLLARLQAAAGNHAVAQLLAGDVRSRATTGYRTPAVQRSAALEKLGLDTSLDVQGAPDSLGLPPELRAGLATAWQHSFPQGKSCEQGGVLVKTAAGKYLWRAGAAGTSGTFKINYQDLQPGDVLIASAHTHPYDASEGGHTDVGFSAGDLANMVNGRERIKFVRSGATTFSIAKTAGFDALVDAANTPEKKKTLIQEMKTTWGTGMSGSTKKTFQGQVRDAIGAVAEKYHLVYYEGQGDSLAKATPWVHVESVAPTLPTDPAALPTTGDGTAPSWWSRLMTMVRGWFGW